MENLIRVNELQTYLDDEVSPTIIDVRAPEAYARGHLPGAVNIPASQLSASLDTIPSDRPIVTYCNMHNPGNSGSENAAELLRDAGYHARALKGGYPEWEESGAPIDLEAHTLPQHWTQQRES